MILIRHYVFYHMCHIILHNKHIFEVLLRKNQSINDEMALISIAGILLVPLDFFLGGGFIALATAGPALTLMYATVCR